MNERRIMYFIFSHSVKREDPNGEKEFIWPMSPNPSMGEEFCNKIAKEHAEIREWMENNPEKVKMAEYGRYEEHESLSEKSLEEYDDIQTFLKAQRKEKS